LVHIARRVPINMKGIRKATTIRIVNELRAKKGGFMDGIVWLRGGQGRLGKRKWGIRQREP
jgi:hypothetical protein